MNNSGIDHHPSIEKKVWYWVSRDKTRTPITKMHALHLVHAIQYLERNGNERSAIMAPMKAELKTRNVKKETKKMEQKKLALQDVTLSQEELLIQERELNIERITKCKNLIQTYKDRNEQIDKDVYIISSYREICRNKGIENIATPERAPYNFFAEYIKFDKKRIEGLSNLKGVVKNSLIRGDIFTLSQLLLQPKEELIKLKGFGQKAYFYLEDYLDTLKLTVGHFIQYKSEIEKKLNDE